MSGLDFVGLGRRLKNPDGLAMQWGIVQANNNDGTATVRLGASSTDLIVPYATNFPALPGRKVGVMRDGADCMITHIMAPAATPMCKVSRRSAVQSIPNATNTSAIFDTVDTDVWNMWNNTTTITIPVTGIYAVSAGFNFVANAAGVRSGFITVNGSALVFQREGTDAQACYQSMASNIPLNAGDQVTLLVNQTSGGALNADGTHTYDLWLSVAWVSWQGQAVLYGPELLTNGGAETLSVSPFSSFWSTNPVCTVTTTAGEFASGAAAFKNAMATAGTFTFQSEPISVVPGQVYKISGKFRSSVTTVAPGHGGWIEMLYSATNPSLNYFAPDTLSAVVVAEQATNTTYKTLAAEWTVPAGIYYISVSWRNSHTAAANFFLDDLSVTLRDQS